MWSSDAACLRERERACRKSLMRCPKGDMVGRLLTYQQHVKSKLGPRKGTKAIESIAVHVMGNENAASATLLRVNVAYF